MGTLAAGQCHHLQYLLQQQGHLLAIQGVQLSFWSVHSRPWTLVHNSF